MKKNSNYIPNKKRAYFIVFGLLIFSFLIVFGGLIFRNLFRHDFPLLFIDSNNKLMYITKSLNNKNDIASIDNADIVYANNDTRNILYTNNKVLYSLDTTSGGMGKKIADNAIKYGFSSDDKYIYYIDNNNSYYIYNPNNESYKLIDNNVIKIEEANEDITIYSVGNRLMYYSFSDDKALMIVDNYHDVKLNSDSKLILYSIPNNDLLDYYVYNITTNTNNIVLSGITGLYSNDANYTKFIYTKPSIKKKDITKAIKDDKLNEDKLVTKEDNQVSLRNQIRQYLNNYEILGNDIYYQNGSTNTLIASNINELYYFDIKNQRYSYTTYTFENNSIDVESYADIEAFYSDFESKKLNSLYYKVSTNEESMAYKNITSDIKIYIRNDNEYYLLVKNNEYYNLYYSKINNKKLKVVGEIDTNLLDGALTLDYLDGYLYCNIINDHIYLDLVNDGKVKTIGTDVIPNKYEVSEGKDSIYYLKNNSELLLYNGIRTSKIADGVHSFIYINNDLLYVTRNYDTVKKTSDLYRLSNNRLTLIYKDIADWYSPLTKVKEES